MTDEETDPRTGGRDRGVGDPLYLPSPEEAVPVLAELLADREWETLARYYDLSGIRGLDDPGVRVDAWFEPHGSWFASVPAPHVAIRWDGVLRYRHPFPPTFEYVDHELDGDVATVVVEGSWDPGDGERQEGRWSFAMRYHEEGWQVLPDAVETEEEGRP